jgi:trehalose 6-phosphate phosphatase
VDTGSPIISGEEALGGLLESAARVPESTALFCDIDGTIAPIAPTPAEAYVPEPLHELLAALARRLGLVTFVTGRSLDDGRQMIPIEGATYVGTHGLETMAADGSVSTDPQAERYVGIMRDIAEAAARDLDCETLGVVLEDKRSVLGIHYRLAPDPAATRHEIIERVVEPARERGLVVATGHSMIEIRPPLPFTKGRAVRHLLEAGDYLTVIGCGDDLTDVTLFDAVHDWGDQDARRRAAAVAAVTDETPQPVVDAADVLVRATPGVHEVLARLTRAVGA